MTDRVEREREAIAKDRIERERRRRSQSDGERVYYPTHSEGMDTPEIRAALEKQLRKVEPASAASNNGPASNNSPQKLSEASAEQWGERFMGSQAFQEGQDAALLGQALNPYRRALRAVRDPVDRLALEALAQQWEDGYVSKSK